jgi:ribosomal protein S7
LRKEKKLNDRLSSELLGLIKGSGLSIEKKKAFYNVALANRPFLYLLKKKRI